MISGIYEAAVESEINEDETPTMHDVINAFGVVQQSIGSDAALPALKMIDFAVLSSKEIKRNVRDQFIPFLMEAGHEAPVENLAAIVVIMSHVLNNRNGVGFGALDLLHHAFDLHNEALRLPILMLSKAIIGFQTRTTEDCNPVEFLVSFFAESAQHEDPQVVVYAFKAAKRYLSTGPHEYQVLQNHEMHLIAFEAADRLDDTTPSALKLLAVLFYNHPSARSLLPDNILEKTLGYMSAQPKIMVAQGCS